MMGCGTPGMSGGRSRSSSPAETSQHDSLSAASTGAALQSFGSGRNVSGGHPNVFVRCVLGTDKSTYRMLYNFCRGLPLQWGENEITGVFGQFGILTSLRLVRHSVTKHSLGYGFVRYGSVSEAQAAISALDNTPVLGHMLQVKFADADAGPPTMLAPSGLTPSDSCYAKHLPANYGVQEVQQLFETNGAVLDVKLFPCLDQFRGASALVHMASFEAADRAIAALNNSTPPGAVQSLIVRFAESAAEKAARLSRREAKSVQRMGGGSGGLQPGMNGMALGAEQLQQALLALNLRGSTNGLPQAAALHTQLPPAPLVPQSYQPQVLSSICVKGMPSNADRLWVFENFSRYGAVAGLRILIDEATGLCNGTGFVNYADGSAAKRAQQAMNGMRTGDKILHVTAQTNHGNSGLVNGNRTRNGSMDAHGPDMSAAAAVLAAVAGQQVLPPPQADWPLLPSTNTAMMW